MLAQQNAESWDAPGVPLGPCCSAVPDPLCAVPAAEGDPRTNMISGVLSPSFITGEGWRCCCIPLRCEHPHVHGSACRHRTEPQHQPLVLGWGLSHGSGCRCARSGPAALRCWLGSGFLTAPGAQSREQMFGSDPCKQQGSGRPPPLLRVGLVQARFSLPFTARARRCPPA